MFIVREFFKFKLFIREVILISIFLVIGIVMDRRRVQRSMGSTADRWLGWWLDCFMDCVKEDIVFVKKIAGYVFRWVKGVNYFVDVVG